VQRVPACRQHDLHRSDQARAGNDRGQPPKGQPVLFREEQKTGH
jgi:hypothetical protein